MGGGGGEGGGGGGWVGVEGRREEGGFPWLTWSRSFQDSVIWVTPNSKGPRESERNNKHTKNIMKVHVRMTDVPIDQYMTLSYFVI